MQLVKGSYRHALYEAAVVITRQPSYSDTGLKLGYLEKWAISGILQADTQAALTTAMLALEVAYSRDGEDVSISTAAGGSTAHYIRAAGCQYVRSTPVSYPMGTGAQYTTYRNYEVGIEAYVAIGANGLITAPGSPMDLMAYTETISYSGNGGPIKMYVPVITGDWPEQQINSVSPIVIVQAGSAIGATGRPVIPYPLYPDRIQNPPSDYRLSLDWPRSFFPVKGQYPISWSYTFTFMGSGPTVFPTGPL